MIDNNDYWKIARLLQHHYEIFYTCWTLGRPSFNENIPTAGVAFDKRSGEYLDFQFNPEFFEELDDYQRSFVVAHEALHVILNHGKRFRGKNHKIANIAADLVINEMLITKYGFDKERLVTNKVLADGCWFDNFKMDVERGHNFEYYYDLLKNNLQEAIGQPIDSHDGLEGATLEQILDSIEAGAEMGLSKEEAKLLGQLEQTLKQEGGNPEFKSAGTEQSRLRAILSSVVNPKALWGKIIKSMSTAFRQREKERDTWTHKHRRHFLLPNQLILPCPREIEGRDIKKLELVAFMDVSGSCIHLKDTFYNILNSVPTDLFDITAHVFDTGVRPVNLKKDEISCGGGTCFAVIEKYIQKNYTRYPYAVLVITDGQGTNVAPQHPDRWHWVLSENYRACIPKESKVFMTNDFK